MVAREIAREIALTPLKLLVAAANALRAMDAARRIALALTAGLVVSLFAPWFVQTTVSHGLTGPRRLSESFTGWDALPAAAYVCLAVATLAWGLVFWRSATVISGLGADGRRAARARIEGGLVSLLGLLAVAWLAAALVDHPGSAAPAVGAVTTVGIRWGVALALVLGLGLAGLGALIVLAAARAGAPEPVQSRTVGSRGARSRGVAAPGTGIALAATAPVPSAENAVDLRAAREAREAAEAKIAREARAAERARRTGGADGRSGAAAASGGAAGSDPAMPDFDFAVSDEPVPAPSRRIARQPSGRESGSDSGTFFRSAR